MSKYVLQTTSIWKFPERGNWATHNGSYRGNWSPHIPRNLILKYSKEGDVVLDMFVGSGTTLIETKILNRNGIGVDINPKSIEIAKSNLDFKINNDAQQQLILGNAQKLTEINDQTIDLICSHPPYANIIKYSDGLQGDLSLLDYKSFLGKIKAVAFESYRVLKDKHICAFMIGDIRVNKNVIPLGFETMNIFVNSGFTLKEIIIKEQFNCSSTNYWLTKNKNFYLLAHEYIFILRK